MEELKNILNFIRDIDWESVFYFIKSVFIVLDVVLVIVFVWVFYRALKFRPKFVAFPGGRKSKKKKEKIKKFDFSPQWKKILENLELGGGDAPTVAIIEADKLLDTALKNLGFEGEFIAERLERAGKTMDSKNLEDVWRAHRIRNNLVHSHGFSVSQSQAKDVLRAYETFLKELNVL